jgi:hypothetical protein
MSETKVKRDQLAADFRRVWTTLMHCLDASGTRVEGEVKAMRDRLREGEDTRLRLRDLQ